MINDFYFNSKKQKLTLDALFIHPYHIILVLSLNYLVSHIFFQPHFKTLKALTIIKSFKR
jgi:hypothetical protein